jgi:hypothetical protein
VALNFERDEMTSMRNSMTFVDNLDTFRYVM